MSCELQAIGLTRVLPGPAPTMLVNNINLEFPAQSFTVITGPSGSGKSSLLYLLGLLDPPSAGEVLVNGARTSGLNGDERARLRLMSFGFVFQFHFLLPECTVLENVMLPMRQLGKLSSGAMRTRAIALLEALGMADRDREAAVNVVGWAAATHGHRPRPCK